VRLFSPSVSFQVQSLTLTHERASLVRRIEFLRHPSLSYWHRLQVLR
jgi:hypothetical protein